MSSDEDEEKVIRSQLLVQGRSGLKIHPESGEEHCLRDQRDENEVDFNTGKPVHQWCLKCHKV